MEKEVAEIQIKIRRDFFISELLSKFSFDDGHDVLPEEKPLIKAACNILVSRMGVIANRWKPVVFETSHSPYYVVFQDLTAEEEKYYRHNDLPIRERRCIEAVIEDRLQGKYTIRVDEATADTDSYPGNLA